MLSARAYSIRKKAMLAISLSWIGGYTNVMTFLCCNKVFTSHVTGTSSNFGMSLALGALSDSLFFGALLLAFFVGAMCSALMTEGAKQLGNRSKYVFPLGLEIGLLSAVMLLHLLSENSPGSHLAAIRAVLGSFAMGIQNATITKISGSVVRTTHLTGVITDLGLEGVQYAFWYWSQARGKMLGRFNRIMKLSSRHPSAQRLLILSAIFVSFIAGVFGATMAFSYMSSWAFLLPIIFLTFLVVTDWRKPIFDIREIDLVRDPELNLHGLLHAVLPKELAIYRSTHLHENAAHRAPNFQLWVDQIPEEKTVVILAFSPLMKFDSNSIFDLEHVADKLKSSHRTLFLAGVTPAQYRALNNYGLIGKIGLSAVYPDLEFAIAAAATAVRKDRRQLHRGDDANATLRQG